MQVKSYVAVEFTSYMKTNPIPIKEAARLMAKSESLFFSAVALITDEGNSVPIFPRGYGDRWHLNSASGTPQITFDQKGEIIG